MCSYSCQQKLLSVIGHSLCEASHTQQAHRTVDLMCEKNIIPIILLGPACVCVCVGEHVCACVCVNITL